MSIPVYSVSDTCNLGVSCFFLLVEEVFMTVEAFLTARTSIDALILSGSVGYSNLLLMLLP